MTYYIWVLWAICCPLNQYCKHLQVSAINYQFCYPNWSSLISNFFNLICINTLNSTDQRSDIHGVWELLPWYSLTRGQGVIKPVKMYQVWGLTCNFSEWPNNSETTSLDILYKIKGFNTDKNNKHYQTKET